MKKSDVYDIVDGIILNLYRKPINLIRIILNPLSIKGTNYFTEKTEKIFFHIFLDQAINILKYGYIDSYYYLYGLNIKNFRKKADYVHYAQFMRKRRKLNWNNPSNSSCIMRNKFYFGIFAKSIGIPTAENVAYVNNNEVLKDNGKQEELIDFIKNLNGEFFCKPIDGECGEGILKLEKKENEIFINNERTNFTTVVKRLSSYPVIIQKSIKQHPEMEKLHPTSINTIRLITVRDLKNNEIVVLPSILRIGTGNNLVDNTSRGGIAVGINLSNGHLHENGLYKPEFGTIVQKHPDTGMIFEDFKIPYFDEAIKKAKYFHSFLDLHSIGWDIAISDTGPIFIEGNDRWEINGPQSCNYGLKKEFIKYF